MYNASNHVVDLIKSIKEQKNENWEHVIIDDMSTDDSYNLAKTCYKMIKELYSETYSEMLNLFYGIHVSLILSPKDDIMFSIKPEPFWSINLPIPEKCTECSIEDCFRLYTINEYMEGDNAWYNEKTGNKENVNKCIKFWSLPNILIVDFKRFNNNNKKINTLISSPLKNLDLSKFVIGYDKDNYKYNLFGICNHSGGCLGGHYTSYVKNANNKWYHFNDTSVSEIDENKIITNKGYCYFYMKCEI